MRPEERWPASLVLVRHGESTGNVARDLVESHSSPFIDIDARDMDVPLSDRGEEQAVALGTWLCRLGSAQPSVVLASPYHRAAQTAEIAAGAAGLGSAIVLDERLREREFGVLDRLTRFGIVEQFPEEAQRRARLGKFYYRPPGGESWCDVGLRVRSAIDSITREHGGERVLVVTHEVVVFMFRYVLERLSEPEVLEIARAHQLANGSVTTFEIAGDAQDAGMMLTGFNEISPLATSAAPITAEPDVPDVPAVR